MLCITMKRGEYFTVGGDTVILLDQMSGERVHVTIDAPRDVPIVRGAVLERNGNPPPQCITALPPRKIKKCRPDAIFRWNDDREQAIRVLEKMADSLDADGASGTAKTLRTQLEQIVPKAWEDNLDPQ